MNVDVRTAWLADLRSGQFPQTMSHLKGRDGYCCLGVLVSRFADTWVGDPQDRMVPVRAGVLLSYGGTEQEDRSGKLSDAFLEEVGLNAMQAGILMTLNDYAVTFDRIADVIEHPAFWTALGQSWLHFSGIGVVRRGELALYDDLGQPRLKPLTAEDIAVLKELEA